MSNRDRQTNQTEPENPWQQQQEQQLINKGSESRNWLTQQTQPAIVAIDQGTDYVFHSKCQYNFSLF